MLQNIVAYSNIGRRVNQEDSYSYGDNFILVADGVGGQVKGSVASKTVSTYIKAKLSQHPPQDNEVETWFDQTIDEILLQMNAMAEENNEYMGMGTTLAMIYCEKAIAYAIHLGDSRIYHFSQFGGLKWRSKDHSLVQELVDSEIISEEQARSHPKKNVITRVLQAKEDHSTKASIYKLELLESGDNFLVCTDGVIESWDDSRLSRLFESFLDNHNTLKEIENYASSHSGDNNTAVLATLEL